MLAIGFNAFLMRVNRTSQSVDCDAMQFQWEFNTKGLIPCFSDEGVRVLVDNRTARGIAGAISSISNLLFFNVYF